MIKEFHGISPIFEIFRKKFPWKSTEFYGTFSNFQGILWNSMELDIFNISNIYIWNIWQMIMCYLSKSSRNTSYYIDRNIISIILDIQVSGKAVKGRRKWEAVS